MTIGQGSAQGERGPSLLSDSLAAAVARSAKRRIDAGKLDLTGHTVITEAATGAYAVTAAAAAAAGATVYALTGDTVYGTAAEAVAHVSLVAKKLSVPPAAIRFATSRIQLPLNDATLVTNSGLVRPIDSTFIDRLPPGAVIALMYEAWEARETDIDFAFAASRELAIVGVDEHHPACDAFQFVGDLALYGMRVEQWPVRGSRIVIYSDNSFADPIAAALVANGAHVTLSSNPEPQSQEVDVAVVAVTPLSVRAARSEPSTLSRAIASSGAYGCVQLWGDLDRATLRDGGVSVVPRNEPRPGHQGFPMSAAGFEAVVRLQVGGLAAVAHRQAPPESPLFGLAQPLEWTRQSWRRPQR